MDPVKITMFEVENCKRVKAVSCSPSPDGLTVIGGRNGAGKTSVLDAIAWALGGEKFRPSDPVREGAEQARVSVTLSNGLTVERRGKNGSLYVTAADGGKHGQTLLDRFVSAFALDLPRFRTATAREKGKMLLSLVGVGDKVDALDAAEKRLTDERRDLGRDADRAEAHAASLPEHSDAPAEPVSVAALADQLRAISEESARRRELSGKIDATAKEVSRLSWESNELRKQADEADVKARELAAKVDAARTEMAAFSPLSDPTEIQSKMAQAETANAKRRDNESKTRALQAAADARAKHADAEARLQDVRQQRASMLAGVTMPLQGLSVVGGEVTYNGHAWDCMSGADQLRVSVAIARALSPACGFVRLDKLEEMDADTLTDFDQWCREQGLQIIGTRVSTGGECTLVIEDGSATATE
jgi:DNA repair ATPase RecN